MTALYGIDCKAQRWGAVGSSCVDLIAGSFECVIDSNNAPITTATCVRAYPNISQPYDETITNFYNIHAELLDAFDLVIDIDSGITNAYGLKIEDVRAGYMSFFSFYPSPETSWAIKTGLGKVEFGGDLTVHSTTSLEDSLNVLGKTTYLEAESLNEGDFTTETKWTVAGDFDIDGGLCSYIHSAGSGTLTQSQANLAITPLQGNTYYALTYTVLYGQAKPNADAFTTHVVTTGILAAATEIPMDYGTHTVLLYTKASPADFVISLVSNDDVTIYFDNMSLKEITGGWLGCGGSSEIIGMTQDGNVNITGIVTRSSGIRKKTRRMTATGDVLVTDEVVYIDTDGGDVTATLPAGVDGQSFRLINVGSATNTATIAVQAGEKILGVADDTFLLEDGEALILTFETTEEWW
jgi:hypothetical protein